jgi:hypothetical protein
VSSPLDDACPRCGTAREPGQDYCLECGLRLPPTSGRLARFRRAWVRRVGWYPGDWFWTTLLAFLVAAAGAAVAIVVTRPASGGNNTGTVFVMTSPSVPLAPPATTAPTPTVDTSTLPTPPEPPGVTTTAAPKPPPNGKTPWPKGQSGWTVVLVSLPATKTGRDRAQAQAQRAVANGLPEVGVLTSSRYSSLHPGYFVVFAGVYDARAEAQSSLNAARQAGFSGAYVRQIAQ